MAEHLPARSFGAAAGAYDRFRPGYPADAVQWAAGGPAPRHVVDLGAGTGILTRALLALGHRVTPVEPDPGMRARLDAATAGVTALDGTAEAVPLPHGAADTVVVGQAYHWFDRDRAHAEAARVLRAGGVFAPLWNLRDEAVPWVARLTAIVDAERGEQGVEDDVGSFGPLFGPVERAEFRHRTTHTADSLVGMITTRSYYLTAPPGRRAELEAAVRDLVATHPDLAGRQTFALPYRTVVFRAVRR